MGLSFAIPIDVAINVADQLKKNGKVIRGWLGVAIQEITEDLSESFGMKDTRGALIAMVEKDSPAERGGILPGDVILKFNKNPLDSSSDLPKFVGTTKPLSEVPVEILRKGKKITLSIKVGEMPNEEMMVAGKKGPAKEVNRIGLSLRELTTEDRKKINGRSGLLVLEVKGPSIASGIRTGDVILALNNSAVQSIASFNQDIRKIPKGKTIALLIYRNGDTLYIPVKVTD